MKKRSKLLLLIVICCFALMISGCSNSLADEIAAQSEAEGEIVEETETENEV